MSRIPPQGELRLSQVITTFGPGAMLDLPESSVIIGGLEHWQPRGRRISEERLEGRVKEILRLDDGRFTSRPSRTTRPTRSAPASTRSFSRRGSSARSMRRTERPTAASTARVPWSRPSAS